MKFLALAEYLEKLEETGSRLEMTRILAELFSKVSPEEGRVIAYLSQGLLGPKYDNPDVGMAEKQVLKALKTLNPLKTLEEITSLFKKEGDLGKTVEKIKNQIAKSKSKNEKLEIFEVYEKLLEIAKASGVGSQERKIRLLCELLISLDPKSAKYAVKMVLGKMRTGFSDMTVLDSLSWMIAGDKSLRNDIERIYNVRADLGEVVNMLKTLKSPESLKSLSVDPIIGTPILVARGERAKTVEEIWERNGISAAEHKLDGLRIQAHVGHDSIKLFSRGLENVTSMYPDIVEGLKKQIKVNCILDGEMIALGKDGRYLPFQETVQRKRKYDILEMMTSIPLEYFVFDLLAKEGRSLLGEPNEKRWTELENIINDGETVKLMPRIIVTSAEEIEKFFRLALKEGTEGIFVKKLSGIYRSGSRDFNWIKYKKSYDETGVADNVDLVVMGIDLGQGKRSGFGIGGFLVGVRDGSDKYLTVAKIGTGLTDEEWKELRAKCEVLSAKEKPISYEVSRAMLCDLWVKPELVVEIKADEITKSPMHTSGYALRFPRLISFRDMKLSEITSKKEIERLFDLQRGGGKE